MAEHSKIVWMVSRPTAVWALARTSDKCVDGGTSGNRVDEGSSDGRVALGRMKTHEIVSVPTDMMMNFACGFPSVPDDR